MVSGGLLIKPRLLFERTHPDEKSAAPQIYGQELTATTFAMAKMNAFLHDFIGADLQIGDTFRNPGFVTDDSELQHFDYVLANPMWNQKEYNENFYANDSWGRFYLWRSAELLRRLGVGAAYTCLPEKRPDALRLSLIPARCLAALAANRPVGNAIFAKGLWRAT